MIEYLIDTNIFITILKGDARLKLFIETMVCAIDTIIYIEPIQGAKDRREVQIIEKYLTTFQLIYFDKIISQTAVKLIRLYSKSHDLVLGDAIIAATCLENNLTLITFNVKDFRFIKGLKILKP